MADALDVQEACGTLARETNAIAVLMVGDEGDVLGHAGRVGALSDGVIDLIGDTVARALLQAAGGEGGHIPADEGDAASERSGDDAEGDDEEPPHAPPTGTRLCAAAVGTRAVLITVFDGRTSLSHVRARMKRLRARLLAAAED